MTELKVKFDKGLHTRIVIPDNDNDVDLEVRLEGETTLGFYVDGKLIFRGDWQGNFKELFKKCLEEFE